MSEVLRPWLQKYFQRLVEQDGPNDAFEEVRKKVQITKFHTDGGQPVKSGELWAQISDKDRWVDVLICPSSVEKHRRDHNGENITQVRLGNFFVTKCRPIIAQIPIFYKSSWSLTSPNLCLEAEVDFIGGRGCSSMHGDPKEITVDPRVKAWESKLRQRGFTPAPAPQVKANAPAPASSTAAAGEDTTSDGQTESPRSNTAVGEAGPWQAHLLRWWGSTELKWPSPQVPREQKRVFDEMEEQAGSVAATPVKDTHSVERVQSQHTTPPADATQEAIPWSPTPRKDDTQEVPDSEEEREPPLAQGNAQGRSSDAEGQLGDEDAEGTTDEQQDAEGVEVGDEGTEDEEDGLAWDKDQEDEMIHSGAQTPASMDAVEDALGRQHSQEEEDDEDSPAQPTTPFVPSSSVPTTPLQVAADISPTTAQSPSLKATPRTATRMQNPTSVSSSTTRNRASSSAPGGSEETPITVDRAGTLPPRYSQAISGQHDREVWTQPSFMRRAKTVSVSTTPLSAARKNARAGSSKSPSHAVIQDPHYRDEHDRQGFLAAGLGAEEDWEREVEVDAQASASQVVPKPKAALRSEIRSDPNATQGLQERIHEASERLRNGKRPSAEEQGSEGGAPKRRRMMDDVQAPATTIGNVVATTSNTSQRSHSSASTSGRLLQPSKGARKTVTLPAQPAADVFSAPTITGDQIPLVRAALSSFPSSRSIKRTSPFSDSDDDSDLADKVNANGETARKRAKREAQKAEARFRFAKGEQAGGHVSSKQVKVPKATVVREAAAGSSRIAPAQDTRTEHVHKQTTPRSAGQQPAKAKPPSTSVPRSARSPTFSAPDMQRTRASTPPPSAGAKISVGLGIKLSPVRVEHVRLLGKSPRRKSGLESPTQPQTFAEQSTSAPASQPDTVGDPEALVVKVTATVVEPAPSPVVSPEPQPDAPISGQPATPAPRPAPEPVIKQSQTPAQPSSRPLPPVTPIAPVSIEAVSAQPPPVLLLGGWKPRFTLDPKDAALCLTIADIGKILQEIDEYRTHGF